MLNYETILSSYDDKMTLMQWLKKVEEALEDASATAFDVTRLDNERVKFSLSFANGEKLETSVIIAQKGEKGDTGTSVVRFYIQDGHLFVELDNGVTQDLGALFSGNIQVNGNLEVTGEVKGSNLLEIMSGYSFDITSGLTAGVTPIYVGVCKTGNKLTIVESLIIDASQLPTVQPRFGNIIIPKEIGEKIFILPNDQYGTFSGSIAPMYEVGSYSAPKYNVGIIGTKQVYDTTKYKLFFGINGFNSASFDMTKQYFVRFEITILLSDNLAGN